MLVKILSRVITTPIFLNIMSCVMGFFVWYSISNSRMITRTINVPIYFDNIKADAQIDAPEKAAITIAGTRADIQKTYSAGALHINATEFYYGKQLAHPTYKNFLLPSAG